MKKGFQERKRRLMVNGKQIPWSKTHTAFAEHLSQVQWAPSAVTQEEHEIRCEATPLYTAHADAPSRFTIQELQTALNCMKKGKAPGPDGLRPDLDYYGELRFLDIMNE